MAPVLAAAFNESQVWTLIGLLMMAMIYVTVIRPMMRRRSDPLERKSAFNSLSQQRSTERQMQNLLVELSEMSRKISAQLDTRATKLEALIRQADERIAMLDGNGYPRSISRENYPIPTAPAHDESEPQPESMPDPRHAEVYALADQGKDIHQIAAQLSRPCGEVELILALRGKSK